MRAWLLCLLLLTTPAWALEKIVLATAGPGNLSHLPVDLMKKIGADRAEGVDLEVHYHGGGPLAFKEMLEGGADFAVAGMPALAGLRARGQAVVSIATVNRVPTFVLMVRRDLKRQVKTPADLKGRVIGINASSMATRSTSQQLTEYLLARAGVPRGSYHLVAAGQSFEAQAAALQSGTVDALMGDEPFASRLREEGKVFFLADLHDLDACRQALGGLFLNAQLATRRDVLKRQPDKARRMVAVLRRTLQWIAAHGPQEIAATLYPDDASRREALAKGLARHKAIYSPDGAFSAEQVRTAEAFFHAVFAEDAAARALRFNDFIDATWAGRGP